MSIFTIQDILQLIFNICPITDKRNLIKTCKTCHKLSILMPNIEKDFQKMINSTKYLDEIKFTSFDNSLYKYTIELVYDGYSHLIQFGNFVCLISLRSTAIAVLLTQSGVSRGFAGYILKTIQRSRGVSRFALAKPRQRST